MNTHGKIKLYGEIVEEKNYLFLFEMTLKVGINLTY